MKLKKDIKSLSKLRELSKFLTSFLSPDCYLILKGKLGVGKTTLVQLIAQNLGIKEKVNSPTFNILKRYLINNDYYLNHFDFFRLTFADNLVFFEELTLNNLNVIE
jgi:tRNA threonylcarbamoyladenosine biosynthesis protein TsaE